MLDLPTFGRPTIETCGSAMTTVFENKKAVKVDADQRRATGCWPLEGHVDRTILRLGSGFHDSTDGRVTQDQCLEPS